MGATDPHDPLLGAILQDRYRVVRKLGEGGMGAVYEGQHVEIQKRVAIKVLHPEFAARTEIVARFKQEALAATSIGNEHIVEVNDMGRLPDGGLFMVLEYLSGRDLARLVDEEGALPIGRAVHIVCQICDAMQAAHDKGIVHRDLKPENVFLVTRQSADFVKVLDFGISKVRDAGTDPGRGLTKTGAVMGTAHFMAPEQAQGHKTLDHRADIYAIGVILFRILTRAFPFDGDTFAALIIDVCMKPAPPISRYRADVPKALEDIVQRCMAKDPGVRFASSRELAEALRPFAGIATAPRLVRAASAPFGREADTDPQPVSVTAGTELPESTAKPRSDVPSTRALPSSAAAPTLTGIVRSPWRAGGIALGLVGAAAFGLAWISSTTNEGEYARERPRAASAAALPSSPSGASPTGGRLAHGVDVPEAQPITPQTPTAPVAPALELIVSPLETVVLVDGRVIREAETGRVTIPTVEGDSAIHELRFEARGFRTRIEDVRLSHSQRIVVALDPGAGVDDRRASARARSSGRAAHGATHEASPPATAPAVAVPPAAAPTAEPISPAAPPPQIAATPDEPSEPDHAGRGRDLKRIVIPTR